MKVCFQMPFRKGCRHHTPLYAWNQFQTVRLHWLSRAFVHQLARNTLQLALQARRHRLRFPCHFIVFSRESRKKKSLKPFHSIKHSCAIGVASIAHIVSYLYRIFLPSSFLPNPSGLLVFVVFFSLLFFFFEKYLISDDCMRTYTLWKSDLSINKFSWRNFIRSKVTFSH